MSNYMPRTISGPVKLRANNRTNVTNRDLHGIGSCALRLPAYVHSRPGERESNGWVDAGGGEESSYVGDSGFFAGGGVAEEDAVADYGDCS